MDPLIFGRNGSEENIFVLLIGFWLARLSHAIIVAVHDMEEIVQIVSGLCRGDVGTFVKLPLRHLGLPITLFFKRHPSCFSVAYPILVGLYRMSFNGVVCD